MRVFNRILLATDFSTSAEAALHYAAAIARWAQANLLLLHVSDTRVAALPHWTDVFRSTEVFAAMVTAAADAMARLLTHPALAGLRVETLMQSGNPCERIVDMAPYVDLVVMGTRGQGGRAINTPGQVEGRGGRPVKTPGRVAQYVVHSSSTPVLFVPEGGGHSGLPAAGEERLPFRSIVLALHFAQYAPQALALSRALATACQAALQVLQVIEPDKAAAYPLEAGAGLYHNIDAITVLLRKRLAEIVPDDPAIPMLERCLLAGHAAEVIARQSIERRADLVVMSVHAYSVLRKFFTMSTVDLVLERVPCPLLAVPFPPSTAATTIPGTGVAGAGSSAAAASA
jgi:nucleotide-binding universal stress UspA family protein